MVEAGRGIYSDIYSKIHVLVAKKKTTHVWFNPLTKMVPHHLIAILFLVVLLMCIPVRRVCGSYAWLSESFSPSSTCHVSCGDPWLHCFISSFLSATLTGEGGWVWNGYKQHISKNCNEMVSNHFSSPSDWSCQFQLGDSQTLPAMWDWSSNLLCL